MDEKRRTGHKAGRSRATNANRRHHTDGLVGRLSYTPAQQDGAIGELRRNRVKDETPHFQQVTPFSQWCPPSKVDAPSSNLGGPWRIARSQGNWLTEFLPEASITEEELEGIFLEEIASAKDSTESSLVSTTSLFSIGEIADVRFESKGDATLSVMAVPSGVSGNVLRLISLARKEWIWEESDVTARTKAPDAKFEGEWCQDALPISLIKFAINASGSKNSKGKAVDTIRWLLVQKETSTTICEPEVRDLPMPTPGTATESGPSSQIFINPLATIPMTQTGGSPQTDVCFIRQPDKNTPQLAIIDQCGYWSLWDITGRRDLRPKTLTPILRMCGNMLSGSIPKLPSSSASYGRPHKVLFLEVERKQSISDEIDLPRKPFLLLNTDQALQLFDIESDNAYPVPLPTFGADHQRILEVAPARLDPAHFFLLTNKSLLWVAVRKGIDDNVDVDTLAICPHQKDSTDPTLRIEVSAGTFVDNVPACFVCVWSSQDTEMNIFWFLLPDPGTPARYHRELVSLKGPSHFVGLGMLPVGRKLGRGENVTPSGKRMREAALRFFQFLTLSQDMEVNSALCVWSDDMSVEIPDPEVVDKGSKSHDAEKQLLGHLGERFVVPDGFDELTALGKRKIEEPDAGEKKPQKPKLNDYSLVAQRLAMAPHEWPRRTLHLEQIEPATGQDLSFVREAVEKEKDDGYMPRHTVLELAKPSHKSGDGIITLARTWADIQPELQDDQDEQDWLYPPEAIRPVPGFNPDDMAQNLKELFPKPRKRAVATIKNQRARVLQKMAAEMFLSNISISAVPPSWSTPSNLLSDSQSQSQSQYSSSQLAFSSSQLAFSSSLPASSPLKPRHHHLKPSSQDQDDQPQEDLLALRLRKYASIPTSPSRKGEPSLSLSTWEIGANPDHITWHPGQDLEAERKKDKRIKKIQARRERASRISQRYFGEDSSFVEESASQQLPSIQPSSSQMLFSQGVIPGSPAFLRSPTRRVVNRPASPLRKEYRAGGRESLSQGGLGLGVGLGGGSQETPSQQPTRSQVLPGIFGGRQSFGVGGRSSLGGGGTGGSGMRVRESLSPFKKKKGQKRKSEGRLSGFR